MICTWSYTRRVLSRDFYLFPSIHHKNRPTRAPMTKVYFPLLLCFIGLCVNMAYDQLSIDPYPDDDL